LERAYALATDVYPDLLRPAVNRFPAWLAWFSPQPSWTMRQPPARDVWLGTLRILAAALLASSATLVLLGGELVAILAFLAGVGVGALGYLGWLAGGLVSPRRRLYAWRKRLAALIAVRYRLAVGALALLLEDDAACARWLQRFLADHQVPYEVPLYDG